MDTYIENILAYANRFVAEDEDPFTREDLVTIWFVNSYNITKSLHISYLYLNVYLKIQKSL